MPRSRTTLSAALALVLAACGDAPLDPNPAGPGAVGPPVAGSAARVTSELDGGAGSLREAVMAANADPSITVIRLANGVGTISLSSPLVYSGAQPLRIDGAGAVVDASGCDCDAFVADGGGDLVLRRLTIRDAGRSGVVVRVPGSASGTIQVRLHEVTLQGNGLFGLHVDDQTVGSPAGVRLELQDTRVLANGFRPGFEDFDGVRVDEGGDGGIELVAQRVTASDNAADGLELDERGPGHVLAHVRRSGFDGNGAQPQTDPADPDLEDGFDIDEADAGSIDARFVQVTANGNYDEGIDLDEEGTGDILLAMSRVDASTNRDENLKLTEDEDELAGGSIRFQLENVTAAGSLDDGIQLEEFGPGDLEGRIVRSLVADNGDDGIDLEQADAGGGTVRLQAVTLTGNGGDEVNADGVQVIRVP